MITEASVRLATLADAAAIAEMSRDEIEHGLGWSWNAARVEHSIRDSNTNVAVIRDNGALLAFGIMSYRDDTAHLLLFAVRRSHQRQGVGTVVLRWLEDVARVAGLKRIHVECRRSNVAARNFYGDHGYHEYQIRKLYYAGIEDAIRLEKWFASE
jgi:[ribosomal protein S18]-alanine N-acetyltransferase